MLKFIARRRFNYIDTIGTGVATVLFVSAAPLYAILVLVFSAIVSVAAEKSAANHG